MEDFMWYLLFSYLFSLIIISGFFGSRVKGLDKDLVQQKKGFENEIKALRNDFFLEIIKIKFESNNKQKYNIGESVGDFIILSFCVSDWNKEGYSFIETQRFYNKYEVFDTKSKTKFYKSEKQLSELILKRES